MRMSAGNGEQIGEFPGHLARTGGYGDHVASSRSPASTLPYNVLDRRQYARLELRTRQSVARAGHQRETVDVDERPRQRTAILSARPHVDGPRCHRDGIVAAERTIPPNTGPPHASTASQLIGPQASKLTPKYVAGATCSRSPTRRRLSRAGPNAFGGHRANSRSEANASKAGRRAPSGAPRGENTRRCRRRTRRAAHRRKRK